MPSSATMEGTISPEMERSIRGVSFAGERQKPDAKSKNDAALREPAIHPEGNAIHGLVEGTISPEMVF